VRRRGGDPAGPSLHESWLPKEHPLYRPRHVHQRLARVCALVFLVGPLAALAVFGQPPAIENHPVHGFPGLSQGWGFFTGLVPWAVDNLSFRKPAIQAADGISRGMFGEPAPLGQAGQSGQNSGPLPAAPAPTTTVVPDNQLDQTSDGYPQVIEGTDGWLYFGYDMQGKCEPAQPLTEVVTNLKKVRSAIERSGRKFVLFVAPDKSSVEPQHLPANYVGKACATAADTKFWQQVDAIGAVDPRPELQAATQETGQPVYFPQDTHWNFTGGLVMTREVAEQAQPGVSATWRVTDGPAWSGPSDLPAMLAQTGTNRAHTYHLSPDGVGPDRTHPVKSDVQAPVRLHVDFPVTGMVGAPTTMIADSFGDYAAPTLAAAFADLTMVSPQTVAGDPNAEADRMVNSQVVVVEVVERDLVAGVSPVTSDDFVKAVSLAMAAHPAH
jgi:hypothetical protein